MFSVGLAFFFCVSLALPLVARAAELYFGSSSNEQGLGNQFAVGVFVDSQQEIVNAFEGQIVFSPEYLDLKDILDGDSMVNFWIERPSVDLECADVCKLKFSGVTPGGYFGDKGHIFSVVFEAKKIGSADIQIEGGKVLLHDGRGTEAELTVSPIKLEVVEDSATAEFKYPFDSEPPESFIPFVSQDGEIFENKLFLVFATQDKLSGVDYYEVAEKKWKEADNYDELNWKTAVSPYLLKDQNLTSYIYVKAVDKSGNNRIQIISPEKTANLLQRYAIYGIILLMGLLVVLSFYILRRKYGGGNRETD